MHIRQVIRPNTLRVCFEKLDILMLDVDTCKAAAKTKSAYAEAFTKCSRNIFFVQINEF